MQSVSTAFKSNGKITLDLPLNRRVPQDLVDEVVKALKSVNGWGSIEIYVQDHSVTQITTRSIRKTKHILAE